MKRQVWRSGIGKAWGCPREKKRKKRPLRHFYCGTFASLPLSHSRPLLPPRCNLAMRERRSPITLFLGSLDFGGRRLLVSEEDAHFLLSQIAKRHEETVGRRYPPLFFFLFLLFRKGSADDELEKRKKEQWPSFPGRKTSAERREKVSR